MKWISTAKRMPDSDQTVLVHVPDGDEPVWMGFHDGEEWRYVDAMPVEKPVTHWAHLPEPPKISRSYSPAVKDPKPVIGAGAR